MLYSDIIERDGYLVDRATGDKVVFYECDPAKNTVCTKQCCGPLLRDATETDALGFCSKTIQPEFQKDGGRKWYAVKKASPDGGEDYWGRDYIE